MSLTTTFSKILPKEERLAVSNKPKSLKIGMPKESTFQEKRICLTPDDVAVLVSSGHHILVESGAGKTANFSDHDYSEAGAEITDDPKAVFGCPIILKVEPPTQKEIGYLKSKSVLMSMLQIKTRDKAYFEALAKKQITALAYENIEDERKNHPVKQSMDEITGTASVLIASELIADTTHGSGILFGNITGVPPIEVVFLGADELVESAVRSALGLGAKVKIFDNSLANLRRLKTKLPEAVFTSTLQPKVLKKALMRCNILIGAMRGEDRSPVVITDDMVQLMKKGSVIVDASIDTGGCVETSRITTLDNSTFVKYGVIHYGVPNVASRYAKTASITLSNILMPYLLKIGEEGGVENTLHFDKGLRSGIYAYHGILTDKSVSKWFDLPYQPINLLFI